MVKLGIYLDVQTIIWQKELWWLWMRILSSVKIWIWFELCFFFFWPLLVQVFRCLSCFPGILYLPVSICLEFSGDLHRRLGDGKIQLDWSDWHHNHNKLPVASDLLNCHPESINHVFLIHVCWTNPKLSPRIYQPRPFSTDSVLTKSNSHWIGFTLMAVQISWSWCCTILHIVQSP